MASNEGNHIANIVLHSLKRTRRSKNFLTVLMAILIIWGIILVILDPWDNTVIIFFIAIMTLCLIGAITLEYFSQFRSTNEFKIMETGCEYKTYHFKTRFVNKDAIELIEIKRQEKERLDFEPDPYDGQNLLEITFLGKDGSRFSTGNKIETEVKSAAEFMKFNWGIQIRYAQ